MARMMDDGSVLALGAVGLLAAASLFGGGLPRWGSRKRLKAVPKRISKTPRRAATGTYVFPATKDFPIGDLYHARLALIYALAPSHDGQRTAIRAAVNRRWPEYNWDAWWRKKTAKKKRKGGRRRRAA
jgi:hypothetical protein